MVKKTAPKKNATRAAKSDEQNKENAEESADQSDFEIGNFLFFYLFLQSKSILNLFISKRFFIILIGGNLVQSCCIHYYFIKTVLCTFFS